MNTQSFQLGGTQSSTQVDHSHDFADFGTQASPYGDFSQYQGFSQTGVGDTPWDAALSQANAVAAAALENGASQSTEAIADQLSELNFDNEEAAQSHSKKKQPHACAYCGIANAAAVVKCVSSGKWFCNGRTIGTASCIITHLVKSKKRECQLHRDSPLGDTLLECYSCAGRNAFALGFVPVAAESSVVLLCRDHAPSAPGVRELGLDLALWQPLIEDRAFVPWLVKVPTEQEVLRARHLTVGQVSRLEEAWKADPAATLDKLSTPSPDEEPAPVALKYDDAYAHQNVFGPLVKIEADYDKALRESQAKHDIRLRWDVALNKKILARFAWSKDDSGEQRLIPGDELQLKHTCSGKDNKPWQGNGIVIKLADAHEEVALELRAGKVPTETTVGWTVEFVWKSVPFDRMQAAMRTFAVDETSVSGYIYHRLLGHDVELQTVRGALPKKFSAPGLPELNASQIVAVKTALQNPLALIQGPPGTGKTVTSASIVFHLASHSQGQVLVAAPSNVAVDHLAEKIEATGLKVVRIAARSREELTSPVEHLTLHYQVGAVAGPELAALRKLRQEVGELSAADERKLRSLQRQAERELLLAADVVCVTCTGAGDPRLSNFRFRKVLVDESTQATEPEVLMPLVMGAKQAVLVGDHCQLGPVIMSRKAAQAGLAQSLFERLVLLGVRPSRLTVQYRMHPALSEFPSDAFYEGALQNGVSAAERVYPGVALPWPVPTRPMLFLTQTGLEEISPTGTSYLNRAEAANVEKAVTQLLRGGVRGEQIGVITPYEGQRAHVLSVLARLGPLGTKAYETVEVSSVDAFQGREKDFIILSCVRSNEHQGIGFLGDPRRLNVALTRARYGLMLLGNARVLAKQPLWNALLVHFRECGCLVEGPLQNLRQSLVQLPPPKKRFDSRSFALGGAASTRFVPQPSAQPSGEPLKPSGPRARRPGAPPSATAAAPPVPPQPKHGLGHHLPASQSSFAIPDMPDFGPGSMGGASSQAGPMTQMGGPSSQSAYAPSYQDSFGEYASQMGPQGASQGYADSLPGSAAYSYATQANHASQDGLPEATRAAYHFGGQSFFSHGPDEDAGQGASQPPNG